MKNAQGALLVELGPTAYHKLGLSLTSFPSPYTGNIVLIDAITPASVADRYAADIIDFWKSPPTPSPPSFMVLGAEAKLVYDRQ